MRSVVIWGLAATSAWRPVAVIFEHVFAIIVCNSWHLSSAYTAELMALTTAVRITLAPALSTTPLCIYSDCKSAISTVKAALAPQCTSRNVQRSHVLTDCINNAEIAHITWVRSHPERRSTYSHHWSYYDWGIHIADAAASGHLILPPRAATPVLVHSVAYQDILTAHMPPATWYWRHQATSQPLHCSPLQIIHPQRVHTYLQQRDTVWRSTDLPPRWAGASLAWRLLGHANKAFGATILRHCLDKCWHGRNCSKGLKDRVPPLYSTR